MINEPGVLFESGWLYHKPYWQTCREESGYFGICLKWLLEWFWLPATFEKVRIRISREWSEDSTAVELKRTPDAKSPGGFCPRGEWDGRLIGMTPVQSKIAMEWPEGVYYITCEYVDGV